MQSPPPAGTPVQVLATHGLSLDTATLLAGRFSSVESVAASLARHTERQCAGASGGCPWDSFPELAEHASATDEAVRAWSAVGWLERGLGNDAQSEEGS